VLPEKRSEAAGRRWPKVDRLAAAYDPRSPTSDERAQGAVRKLEVLGDHVTMRQSAGCTKRT
jgi:hypothetical protein